MKTKKLAIILVALFLVGTILPLFSLKVKAEEEVPYGPWVDEIDFFAEKEPAKVVDMLEKGDMHLYLIDISDPDLFQKVKASPNLKYKFAYGLYNELTFNPVGPTFKNGEFNPFSNPKIREAMNYIVDRKYIADEIFKGLAKPKLISFISAFPEYGRLADVIKLLEAKYSYNFEKGKEIIYEEMSKMGAVLKEGKWYYNDKPVVIKFLIRIEDQRKQIGDYVSSQLEKLGFTVERMYKSSREASPIWLFGNPADGKWHMYTGGWITTGVSRDDSGDFAFFYTDLGLPVPLWQAYKPDPVFYEMARKLYNNEWKTWEERMELMKKCLEYALKDSVRIWLVDQITPFVCRKEIEVATDLSSGFNNPIWIRTLKFTGKIGGTIKAANREVLVDPWNPVAGTNWIYDVVVQQAVNDPARISNPYTGLPMPNRFINATVYVEKSIDTKSSSDWVKVYKIDKIEVPTDAWFDYNTTTKELITTPPGTYAKAKVIINYGDPIGKVKYHDGSVMSEADWFALWVFRFYRVDPNSPLYDESAVPGYKNWRRNFRGMRIVSIHPLVIEYYTNYTHPEVEFMVPAGWPNMPWHVTALGIYVEENGLGAAFSANKADKLKVEWMNYIGGPSLTILEKALNEMIEKGYIPFKEWASKYITPEEAKARYQNLKAWYEKHHHFWVASGPFYLDSANFQAHEVVVKAFREYTFKADKWAWLSEPPIPETAVEVPENVVPGLEATFTVKLSFKGKPYPNDRIEFVKYLILDSAGNVLASGEATPGETGVWAVKLNGTETAKFVPGSYKIMTIALSKDVAMPSIKEFPFTVIPQISYFQALISQTQSQINAKMSSLESSLTETQSKLSSLEGTVAGLQSAAYGAIGIAILALIVAIYAIFAGKKKAEK